MIQEMDFKKLDEILEADNDIRYVSIVDSKGNIIDSRMNESFTRKKQDEEEEYMMDLQITKKMLDVFNGPFGRTILLQTIREKTWQLIYYHDFLIIYIACEPSSDITKMSEIAAKVQPLVKELVRTPDINL